MTSSSRAVRRAVGLVAVGVLPTVLLSWRTWALAAALRADRATPDAAATAIQQQAIWGVLLGGCFLAGAAAMSGRRLSGHILEGVGRLGQGARCIATATEEMARASGALSKGASDQRAILGQTAATLTAAAAVVTTHLEETQEIIAAGGGLSRDAREAALALGTLRHTLDGVRLSHERVAAIVDTLNEIAFAARLLARNAAADAERCGGQNTASTAMARDALGVAERAALTAVRGTALIEESVARAGASDDKISEVVKATSRLAESLERMTSRATDIRERLGHHSCGIDRVRRAIAQMEEMTLSATEATSIAARASERLRALGSALGPVLDDLETLGGGARDHAAPAGVVPIRERRRGLLHAPSATARDTTIARR